MPKKIKILIVDDQDVNLKFMERILEEDPGLDIITASSGERAVELIKSNRFALALLDIKMPGLDGFETARIIKNITSDYELPVIFVTALTPENQHEFSGYEAGAVDLLYKPINPFILKSKVKIFKKLYMQRRLIEIKSSELEKTVKKLSSEIESRKKLEDQLVQAQKMEAIGTLAGGIAHDFNNILSAVMGYVELALMDLPAGHSIRKNLDQVLKASNRAKNLVEHILVFSRKAGKKFQPIIVRHVVKESLELLRASIPSYIKIIRNISNETITVNANATQIHQVVMNLCTNAWHAIGDNDGEIEVTLKPVFLGKEGAESKGLTQGNYLKLAVRDSGCGMTKKIMNRIFEPYYTTKKAGTGTGMGLSVVHGILVGHGGVINVESVVGVGTLFTLFFPVYKMPLSAEPEQILEIKGGTGRIMVVDDEDSIVDLEIRMLSKLGYNVKGFSSSLEALESFKSTPEEYDLIITDMTMPDMMGDLLAKEIKRINPGIPVVLCTGYHRKIAASVAADFGVDSLLLKPINIRELSEIIHQLI